MKYKRKRKKETKIRLIQGDNLKILPTLKSNSVHAIITDPPYGLVGNSRGGSSQPGDLNTPYGRSGPSKKRGFMGKEWDGSGIENNVDMWKECFRLLKPGGHLLSFGGSRTYHRMACAIEDAGFEIRDQIMWVYGSGFPKSHNVGKAVDKLQGNKRKVGNFRKDGRGKWDLKLQREKGDTGIGHMDGSHQKYFETKGNSEWEGFGTALKPAHEPICLARKPLTGTVAENVLKHGCGALNIDGCRVAIDPVSDASQLRTMNRSQKQDRNGWGMNQNEGDSPQVVSTQGRWPVNFCHDGSEEVTKHFPNTKSGTGSGLTQTKARSWKNTSTAGINRIGHNDFGSAARFFFCAKSSKRERSKDNNHPTVKPLKLMMYLCKLITPPNGIILDPFMGSGTTGISAKRLGFGFIGIEKEKEYYNISEQRINKAKKQIKSLF
jgi:site-specific DNA-methyltransferase (adenine-specific)